ncbi:hypothetical protein Pcinc_020340 [Petrolisthes cinctipes]|uniref:F5/8 type C domain-containing protein n=1 Tax=Petrolisthes cinctipes TaxID=88211 RepID=A0AAE1FMZ6_PETCI|nr:hypothetical protein Pcinc_020340 [Petrolisthes cinctipes]
MTLYGSTRHESIPIPQGADLNMYCGQACTRQDWCKLWCADSSSDTPCILSNIVVMPSYNELNTADALTCYTSRPKDHATNAVITAGQQVIEKPLMVKENLVDGIYSYYKDERFSTRKSASDKWFVLDFGRNVSFQHVVLYAQEGNNAVYQFRDVEVRVGNVEVTTPPSGFTDYVLFGFFQGRASPGQVVDLWSPNLVWARFVSVQMLRDNGYGFQLGHVEVF